MSDHSLYSPSSAYRWLRCSKSLTLTGGIDKPNKASIRGSVIHEICERLLTGNYTRLFYDDYTPTQADYDDIIYPYYNFVKNFECTHQFIEQKVFITNKCYGTADAICYDENKKELHVIDLKTGFKRVRVDNNEQLMLYAIGSINFLKEKNLEVEKVFAYIFNDVGVRSSEVKLEDLNKLRASVEKVEVQVEIGNTEFVVHDVTCKYCPHILSCPEMRKVKQEQCNYDFNTPISEDDIKYFSSKLKAMKAFDEKFKEYVVTLLNTGEVIEGIKLKETKGNYKCVNNKKLVSLFKDFGIDESDLYDSKLKSKTQLFKLIKKDKEKEEQALKLFTREVKTDSFVAISPPIIE